MRFWYLLVCTICVHTTFAATRYVATTGSDGGNDCSAPGAPCLGIEHAVDMSASGDLIQVAAGTYTESDIDVTNNVVIQGAGAGLTIIQAAPTLGLVTNRVFDFKAGQTSVVNDVTIRHGYNFPIASDGGGIRSRGDLTLNRVDILSNVAGDDGAGVWCDSRLVLYACTISSNRAVDVGGGVFSGGYLDMSDSTVTGNTTTNLGGGIGCEGMSSVRRCTISGNRVVDFHGGGIRSQGDLTITRSEISGNAASEAGGGISAEGFLHLEDSNISSNWTGTQGGGLWNRGTAAISRCSFSYNDAAGVSTQILAVTYSYGGGGIENDGVMTIHNSTLSQNTATNRGGGIRNNTVFPKTLTVSNCTVAGNVAASGGGIYNESIAATFVLGHTLVGDNAAGVNPDGTGLFSSLGYNLIENITGITLSGIPTGNITGTDPVLGALQDNGGPTFTHALLAGSPAFNAGVPGFAPPPYSDQRGIVPRVEGGQIDIGAYEASDGDDDNDDDELPDSWEIVNMLDPNDAAGAQGAAGNPDTDPSSNEVEYTADTDPQNSNSFWHVTAFSLTNAASLSYPSSTGRVYTLQGAAELEAGTWSNITGQVKVPGSGHTDTLSGPAAPGIQVYRITVDLP